MPSMDRLGICSWSLHAASADDLVENVRQLGLPGVQLALDPIRHNPGAWDGVTDKCSAAGAAIISGMFGAVGEDYTTPQTIRATGGIVPDATWDENWRNFQRSIEIAADLGLKSLTTHAGFMPPNEADPAFAKMINRLRRMTDAVAERLDGWLLFETGQETAETLERFLTVLDRERAGVNFDPANMILYDMGEPIADLKRVVPWVRQVHIKDAVAPTTPGAWGSEVAVGAGAVDWRAFLETLRAGGFTGWCMIEREAGAQRIPDIRQAIETIRSNMPAAT